MLRRGMQMLEIPAQGYLKVEALDFSDLLDKAHCELELKYSNITACPVGISGIFTPLQILLYFKQERREDIYDFVKYVFFKSFF